MAEWRPLGPLSREPLAGGLINETVALRGPAGARYVLQRVNPIFDPAIHATIHLVTEHLARRGLTTPRLRRTAAGGLYADLGGDGIWRLLTRAPGVPFDAVVEPAQAESAGALVARFHTALADLGEPLVAHRAGVHDTPRHLEVLVAAVDDGRDHRLYDGVARLAESVLEGAERLPRIDGVPERPAHGDLKLNNVLFAGAEPPARNEAVCLVDLDTLGPMALHLELGDAWRSWCNPAGEDTEETWFDLAVFEASARGYAAACGLDLSAEEREALVHGVEWITLELAARFAADALVESYFGWDSERFDGAGEHNLVRALGQWGVHERALAVRRERAAVLAEAFSR